jgi:hypothetical protein
MTTNKTSKEQPSNETTLQQTVAHRHYLDLPSFLCGYYKHFARLPYIETYPIVPAPREIGRARERVRVIIHTRFDKNAG